MQCDWKLSKGVEKWMEAHKERYEDEQNARKKNRKSMMKSG